MPTGISGLYKNTKGAKIARGEKIKQTNFDRIKVMSVEENELLDSIDFDVEDIGEFVFLTTEEAEKALKERESNV